jgi:hypothetical protein
MRRGEGWKAAAPPLCGRCETDRLIEPRPHIALPILSEVLVGDDVVVLHHLTGHRHRRSDTAGEGGGGAEEGKVRGSGEREQPQRRRQQGRRALQGRRAVQERPGRAHPREKWRRGRGGVGRGDGGQSWEGEHLRSERCVPLMMTLWVDEH